MSVTPSSSVVGVFTDQSVADDAMEALREAGFDDSRIRFSAPRSSGGVFGELKRLFTGSNSYSDSDELTHDLTSTGFSPEAVQYYTDELNNGRVILVVDADDREQEALSILHEYGATNTSAQSHFSSDTTQSSNQEVEQPEDSTEAPSQNGSSPTEHASEPAEVATVEPEVVSADQETHTNGTVAEHTAEDEVTQMSAEQEITHAEETTPEVATESQAEAVTINETEQETEPLAVVKPEQETAQPAAESAPSETEQPEAAVAEEPAPSETEQPEATVAEDAVEQTIEVEEPITVEVEVAVVESTDADAASEEAAVE